MKAPKKPKQAKRKPRTHRKGERAPALRCAGCGEPDAANALLRLVVAAEYGVVVDPRGRLPGTPLQLHPAAACLEQLAAQPEAPALAALRSAIERFLDEAILSELSRVAAAGQVVGGHDKLATALREGRIVCVLGARDAAAGTLASLRRAAGPALPFHAVELDKEALGARVGQPARAAVGVPSSRASAVLERWLGLRWRLDAHTS